MKKTYPKTPEEHDLYKRQNRMIHLARAQLGMALDDCRELARNINGKASLSALTLQERWELIEALKEKGADVHNPQLSSSSVSSQGSHRKTPDNASSGKRPAPSNGDCPVEQREEQPSGVYPARLAYWNKRFQKGRRGFASNRQLAWIEALWKLDWDDGRTDWQKGLRGFLWRQTKNLEDGPISDLAFLKDHQVAAIMTPLKKKSRERQAVRSATGKH